MVVDYERLGLETFLRWESLQGEYESVYSRAQFAASHFLAAQVKLSRPAIAWDAEFSDPLSHDVLGNVREAYADYRRASELDPDWADPQTELQRFRVVNTPD